MTQYSDNSRHSAYGLFLSGIFATFGIIFLALLYLGLFTGQESLYIFGLLNDVVTIFHFALTIPAAFFLHTIFKENQPRLSRAAFWMNILGVSVVIVFQTLLVAGVLSFAESLGFVLIGGMLFGGWILIIGRMGRETGAPPLNRRLSVLAFFYIGYPVWAFRVGRFIQTNSLKQGLEDQVRG